MVSNDNDCIIMYVFMNTWVRKVGEKNKLN